MANKAENSSIRNLRRVRRRRERRAAVAAVAAAGADAGADAVLNGPPVDIPPAPLMEIPLAAIELPPGPIVNQVEVPLIEAAQAAPPIPPVRRVRRRRRAVALLNVEIPPAPQMEIPLAAVVNLVEVAAAPPIPPVRRVQRGRRGPARLRRERRRAAAVAAAGAAALLNAPPVEIPQAPLMEIPLAAPIVNPVEIEAAPPIPPVRRSRRGPSYFVTRLHRVQRLQSGLVVCGKKEPKTS